ncbi:hypothetical protein H4R19_003191 [Coemansia spiralis]|nr:hypothetical protein H4R19_003191 [Coemansia spiralis]
MLAMALPAVQAHTYVTSLTIDGKEQPVEKCVRPWWENENFPVNDPNSQDLLCRTKNMDAAATAICPVAAGSTIKVLWTESGKGSRAISPSHWGPCLAYMSPMEANGKGNVWFKIAEDGYDASTKKWCTQKLNDNKGYMDVTIPADLKPGNYLLRTELIALHEADREFGADQSAGAQYYPNCVQLKVTGSGTSVPAGVAIPGIYKKDDPGIHFNLWDLKTEYQIPGPALYKSGGGGSLPTTTSGKVCTKGKSKGKRGKKAGKRKRDEM